uniref:Glutathione S-transferase 3, mitochondrial n=1 Tax=Pinctada imbricata TaxID=66713 RepID=G4WCQ7_PINIB|nr:microsomal glutathione S-transferase 3 [Pinctada imbricata]
MGNLSKVAEILPKEYGCVIFTGIATSFVNMWMGINVAKARKKYEVPYPTMYSADSKEFNCIQRAHQNTLERYPEFLMLLFVAGLEYPRIAAGAGSLYYASRIAFAMGYYTGDPEKRRWGSFGYIGLLTLLGCSVGTALKLLEIIKD